MGKKRTGKTKDDPGHTTDRKSVAPQDPENNEVDHATDSTTSSEPRFLKRDHDPSDSADEERRYMTKLPHRDQKPTSLLWGYKEWDHSDEDESHREKGERRIENDESQRRELNREEEKGNDGPAALGKTFEPDVDETSEVEGSDSN